MMIKKGDIVKFDNPVMSNYWGGRRLLFLPVDGYVDEVRSTDSYWGVKLKNWYFSTFQGAEDGIGYWNFKIIDDDKNKIQPR